MGVVVCRTKSSSSSGGSGGSSKRELQYSCRRRFRSKMEFFAPQLRDTRPFHFVSEYYSVPLRAARESVTPICFWGLKKPRVSEVVQAGDPILHEPALEVRMEDIGSARIEKIINDMVATMRGAPGVGLAAPQIGEQLQVCHSFVPWLCNSASPLHARGFELVGVPLHFVVVPFLLCDRTYSCIL